MLTYGDPRVPRLTIEVNPSGSFCDVQVSGAAVEGWSDADRVVGRVPRAWGELGQLAQGTLRQFVATTRRSLSPDWERTGEALDLLLEDGQIYWEGICGRLGDRFLERLQEALSIDPIPPEATEFDYGKYARAAPLIEVKCPRDTILPIEMLPLGLNGNVTPPRTREEVFQNALFLGGFSCRIRYVLYDMNPDDKHSANNGLLQSRDWASRHFVAYLRSRAAPFWDDMESFFTSNHLSEGFRGPYPRDDIVNSPEDLALYMLAPQLLESSIAPLDGASEGDPILYVHAHGRQGLALGDSFFFEFEYRAGRKKSPIIVNLRDIRKARKRVSFLNSKVSTSSLFLNSCYTAGDLGKELLSCSMMLLDAGIDSLVAPRDETPAGVARELAQAYYRFLLPPEGNNLRMSCGEAILAARIYLLAQYHNPLGVIYSHYGNSV